MCPLQGVAKGNFWGSSADLEAHDVQPAAATQTSVSETPTTSASVSTTASTSEKKKIKKIEFVGNNVIEQSLILQQMKLQVAIPIAENLCNEILKLSMRWDILPRT